MSDYESIVDILDKHRLDYSTDWNRDILLGGAERIAQSIVVTYVKEDGSSIKTKFIFNSCGELESVFPLTN